MGTSVPSLPSVRDVFVYGTLLADEIVSIILGRIPSSVPSSIPDFHRHSIKGRVYPAIIPAKGHQVNGKVLFGLTDDEFELLDEFEDVEYTRQIVEPVLLNKQKDANVEENQVALVQSYVYVWADTADANLFGEWDYEGIEARDSVLLYKGWLETTFLISPPSKFQAWRKEHLSDYAEMCRNFVFNLDRQ